jgi:small subunit ribosomal protein S1
VRAWEKIVEMYKSGDIVTGLVTSKTKGGLIVEVYGMETFLPGSQIDVKPVTDYDQFVGKTMEFKVVKINEAIKNAVVSHKALIESDIEQQRAEIISKLEKGQVLEGTVKNITDFGAFLDLGGLDGLLYITDISWGRINHPSEVLHLDQKLNVVVLDFDDDKKRISLGLKQLTPHPWDTLPENIKEGEVVKGKVVNIEDYGAFLEILPGVEGLVHVSEITWANTPINAKEFFTLGQEYEAKIVTLNKDERKMSLSIKQMTEDPWDTIETRFPEGSKHTGVVKNITPYGVFVELALGIGGMIHISDLSWLKRFNNPNEYTKVGENIDVINWTNNIQLLIQRSLTPAKITSMEIDTENKHANVYLKPDQVSLAIGRRGVNIKLASELTGFELDVFRDTEDELEEVDIDLDEFADEIQPWVIAVLKGVGCDTAKSVLALTDEDLERRTDLEKETIKDVKRILEEEFSKD